MNHGRNVTLDAALYEAMAACYYGGGPDFWQRTGSPRPGLDQVPTEPEPLEQTPERTIVFNGDVTHEFTSDIFNRFSGPGTRVIPMDLAAEPENDGSDNTEDTDAS